MKTGTLKPNKRAVFLFSFLLGIILFTAIYGIRVIDPQYDLWIFDIKDPDIKQHYIGWCHFRNSDWSFPLGLMNSLSWPFSISVLYTDSIPLFAVIFKLFRNILPETFQYLGLFGMISMGLTGGFAGLILHKLLREPYHAIIGSAFFSVIPHLLQRMFFHTTLTAQWLILLPLLIWFSDSWRWKLRKRLAAWTISSFLAITIHPYLWMMVFIIWFFSELETFYRNKELPSSIIIGLSYTVIGIFGLFIEGGFYGNVSTVYYAGGFESNLNSLFNPMGIGLVLPDLDLVGEFQYEGFGYLGLGIIIMFIISLAALLVHLIRDKRKSSLGKLINSHPRRFLLFLMALVFALFSVYPTVSFGTDILFTFPRIKLIDEFFGIFRSTGRFIWPLTFLIALTAFVFLRRYTNRIISLIVLSVCLLVQFYDLSGTFAQTREDIVREHKKHSCDLDSPELLAVLDNYEHLVMFYDNNIDLNKYAFFAYEHGLTINRFYFSRNIDSLVDEKLAEYTKELEDGEPEDDCIYIFDPAYPDFYMPYDLHIYDLTGTIIGVKDTIPGLEEIN
ncbi:MAG: DUF6311 domain-containing protein [Lachnospiraceae bacterium]|nr:DUF6311 domain-containing protein [Lachnospiraceae bacterium]